MSEHEGPTPDLRLQVLERLVGLVLPEPDLSSVLQTTAELTAEIVPEHTDVSVTVLTDRRPATVASTGPLSRLLDEHQYAHDEGPCLVAARDAEEVEVTDLRTDGRWPAYRASAVDVGSLSSLSVPLVLPSDGGGAALNVYAREAGAFDAGSRASVRWMATTAGAAVATARALDEARRVAAELEAAMASRAVIEQAKGILIERHRLTPEQAFARLAEVSMHTNRKVRDIAADLVRTGELPGRR
ncbi:hypothetical protein JOD57_004635 [Geodermatophilus bullaregiensis]|uniref:GAF and ANTAR domain-containing protein n=1 Tax=Geodermatophilus bullaregiensis TaxID=1564160 RepID=UPI0027DDF136|nr:GAF and ANTAR domain-containing protein [Geodermatophilus bullaregiensis]MBM7808798.1 hypothetical protein [Geodermatophilus bullaregiensis]